MSDILIKGMEMPEKCGKCRFATSFECQVTKNFITTFNVRQVDCPLVPVPPHGRLIDADALLESIKEAKKKQPEISDVYDEDYFALATWVAYAPTIIEAEEGE